MFFRVTLPFLLVACHFDTSTGSPNGAVSDATIPGLPDADLSIPDADPAAPGGGCVGELFDFPLANLGPCDPPQPSGPLNLNIVGQPYVLNTTDGRLQVPFATDRILPFSIVGQSDGPELFVMTVDGFEIGSLVELAVTGTRPLVLLSTSSIYLFGDISVAGRGVNPGPGGDLDSHCLLGRGTNGASQQSMEGLPGGKGGSGGGFGSAGGTGAQVAGADGSETPGGMAVGTETLTPLRGGCSGGNGGLSGGTGGGGGGAIQFVAADGIIATGTITASGGGGRGVTGAHSGGGGGGSGGAILLQAAAMTTATAELTVNGGGGGEGSEVNTSSDPGDNGAAKDPQGTAAGGSSNARGGDGGDGGNPTTSPEDGNEGTGDQFDAAGGGGGGGGAGRIRLATP